jgi:hypothetical protein
LPFSDEAHRRNTRSQHFDRPESVLSVCDNQRLQDAWCKRRSSPTNSSLNSNLAEGFSGTGTKVQMPVLPQSLQQE